MKIQESAENYLETILILKNRKGIVRSIDIVNELDFSKPSVSVAMKNLRENGYIEVDDNGYISLLPEGRLQKLCMKDTLQFQAGLKKSEFPPKQQLKMPAA